MPACVFGYATGITSAESLRPDGCRRSDTIYATGINLKRPRLAVVRQTSSRERSFAMCCLACSFDT